MAEEVVLTGCKERHACLYVDGVVRKDGRWLKAAFTVHKSDIEQMSRAEFEAFALRNLPHYTEDIDWSKAS
jgi:hypothetical protein